MSQKLANSVISDLRRVSAMINSMTFDDPTGEIGADAFILSEMAEVLDELDWDLIRRSFVKGNNENSST